MMKTLRSRILSLFISHAGLTRIAAAGAAIAAALVISTVPAFGADQSQKDQQQPQRREDQSPAKAGTLQVKVVMPPSWSPMFEDRITDAFVSHVSDVFRQQGFKGEIKQVYSMDEPSPGCCLLTIDLVEWRMNHIGNIDCTFTANLQTDSTTRYIGMFNGMAIRWMNGPGRFGLSDTFGDAAEDALRSLYNSLAKTDLVPGIRKM